MKIVRFLYRQEPRYGLIKDDHIELIQGDPYQEIRITGVSVALSKAKLLAPAAPTKIIAVGLNYLDHVRELGMELPGEPCLFMKPPSSVVGPGDPIVRPAMSDQVDYEAELAVVIGKPAKDISADRADEYIFGYTCGNDVTARDLQRLDGQWTRSKSFDTFCPLGPHIETDIDPGDLSIKLSLNGEKRQESRTSQMVFHVPRLIEFISEVMTICPGDIILTGTPFGVGQMHHGDICEVEIEGIGGLTNQIV